MSAVDQLVRALNFTNGDRDAYVVDDATGRAVLVLTSSFGSRGGLVRHSNLSWKTIRSAVASGLVTVSDRRVPVSFSGRQLGDSPRGYRISFNRHPRSER